jgi:hypothetical protein
MLSNFASEPDLNRDITIKGFTLIFFSLFRYGSACRDEMAHQLFYLCRFVAIKRNIQL